MLAKVVNYLRCIEGSSCALLFRSWYGAVQRLVDGECFPKGKVKPKPRENDKGQGRLCHEFW